MSTRPHDPALDALLADYAPPPVPEDLAARVAAAAVALPQAAPRAAARPWRDRRGAWLRRPLLIGGAALGLAFSGAVAATYAGVELPPKIQSALAELPFVKARPAATATPPRRGVRPVRTEAAPSTAAPGIQGSPATERPLRGFWRELSPYERRQLRRAPAGRRPDVLRQIVEARRSAGLPTPSDRQIEQAIERRRAIRQQRRAEREGRIEAPMRPSVGAEATDDSSRQGETVETLERRRALRAERQERRRAIREERLRRWRARQERLRTAPPEEPRAPASGAEIPSEEGERRGPGLLGGRAVVTGG